MNPDVEGGSAWRNSSSGGDSRGADRQTPPTFPVGRGELILVVDDDAPVRDIVSTILGRNGYRVVACSDGLEAMAVFHTMPTEIPAVVTDVDMPHLDGVGLARALLQVRPDIRLLAMSGVSRRENRTPEAPAIQDLAHAFLPKPFKAEELLKTLYHVLHPVEK